LQLDAPAREQTKMQPEQSDVGGLLDEALRVLTATPGVTGGLVATSDGLPLAVRLRPDHDRDGLAAAAASVGRLVSKAIAELGRGDFQLAALDTDRLRLIIAPLSLGYLLAVAEADANLGVIAAELANAAKAAERAAAAISSDDLTEPETELTALGGRL